MSKFKVGDIVPTRDGQHQVEILKTDAPGDKPIIGMYVHEGTPIRRYADGRFRADGDDDEWDLTPPKRTRTVKVWVNVYPDGEVVHDDEDDARRSADPKALAVAVPATFTLEY